MSTLEKTSSTGAAPQGSRLVRRLALANLIANAAIIATGTAVRLTGSGLGCPVWPRCTPDSFVTTPAMGLHGLIEYGNRMLTFVLAAIVAALIVAALRERPRRRPVVALALTSSLAILGQAALGGLTVLTDLDPWLVGCHFLVSIAIIYAAYALWVRTGEGDGPRVFAVPDPVRWIARLLVGVSAAVLVIGTMVTGSGPHSGDGAASRNGLDPATVSQLHADAVFLLLGLTVAAWFAVRAVGQDARPVAVLLGVELAQGAIGFVQYALKLPVLAVELHVIGATLLWIAAIRVLFALRVRPASD